MNQTFTLVLNSATATNTSTHTDASNLTYRISGWANLIPEHYAKNLFKLSANFSSDPINATLTDCGMIFSSGLRPQNVTFGDSGASFIASFQPVALQSTYGMYRSTVQDAKPITVQYPTQDLAIQLFHNDGTLATEIKEYVLVLTFELIN